MSFKSFPLAAGLLCAALTILALPQPSTIGARPVPKEAKQESLLTEIGEIADERRRRNGIAPPGAYRKARAAYDD